MGLIVLSQNLLILSMNTCYHWNFVGRTYLPIQNIAANNNVLEIAVIEGNYGKFILKNNSLVNDSTLQSIADNVKAKDNIIL